MFACSICKSKFVIRWTKLGNSAPACRKCGRKLTVVTACLNKGMIPKISLT